MSKKLLDIKGLEISFYCDIGEIQAVRNISFSIDEGESLGIVGESGSGKSVTSQAIMNLIEPPGKIKKGEIFFKDQDLITLKEYEMRIIRGNEIAMIFQDPMTSLNSVYTIGNQIMSVIKQHQGLDKVASRKKAIEMLDIVGIPSPEQRLSLYPHECSGGMKQRVMIAIALSCEPDLLIADEPTTALDVTIQAQILELLKDIKTKMNTSILMISHDLGIVADLCTKIIVMYGGQIMEIGDSRNIFYQAKHPYTIGLMEAVPKITKVKNESKLKPILGTPPDMLKPPKGCPFAARCHHTMNICLVDQPLMINVSKNHHVACWLHYPSYQRRKS